MNKLYYLCTRNQEMDNDSVIYRTDVTRKFG